MIQETPFLSIFGSPIYFKSKNLNPSSTKGTLTKHLIFRLCVYLCGQIDQWMERQIDRQHHQYSQPPQGSIKNFQNLPKSERIPQAVQTIKDIPTVPVFWRIPFGEMKIPAPIIVPVIMDIPLSKVIFFFSTTLSPGSTLMSYVEGNLDCPWGQLPLEHDETGDFLNMLQSSSHNLQRLKQKPSLFFFSSLRLFLAKSYCTCSLTVSSF